MALPVENAVLASPEGKTRYRQRGCSIEPFFATLKAFFHLDPLHVQGKTLASVVILLSLYAWDLLVLLNFIQHRPLGEVKPILDLLLYDYWRDPDGKHLATENEDGTTRIYVLDINELIALAQSRLTRTWTVAECQRYLHTDTCPPQK